MNTQYPTLPRHHTKTVVVLAAALAALVASSPLATDLWPNLTPKSSARSMTTDDRSELHVKRRMIASNIDIKDLDVRVHNKTAYLGGFAYDKTQQGQATTIAASTPGVVRVDNRKLRHVVDLPSVEVVASTANRPFDRSTALAWSEVQASQPSAVEALKTGRTARDR